MPTQPVSRFAPLEAWAIPRSVIASGMMASKFARTCGPEQPTARSLAYAEKARCAICPQTSSSFNLVGAKHAHEGSFCGVCRLTFGHHLW